MNSIDVLRVSGTALALGLVAMASPAAAGACGGSFSFAHEVTPTTRLLLPIPSALKAANPRAEGIKGLGVPCERGAITVEGQSFVVTGQGGDGVAVRRAAAGEGKAARAALLVPFKKAEVDKARGSAPSKADPVTYYALATVKGARVNVWRVYDGVPGDDQLKTAMSDSLWEVGSPLLSFSLDFKGPRSGPETLKDWD